MLISLSRESQDWFLYPCTVYLPSSYYSMMNGKPGARDLKLRYNRLIGGIESFIRNVVWVLSILFSNLIHCLNDFLLSPPHHQPLPHDTLVWKAGLRVSNASLVSTQVSMFKGFPGWITRLKMLTSELYILEIWIGPGNKIWRGPG